MGLPSFATPLLQPTLRAALPSPRGGILALLLPLLAIAIAPCLSAQSQTNVSVDTAVLMRHAVQHQLAADKSHHPVCYLVHRTDERRNTTKEIIETADGDVARLVAIDGKPLSAEANRAELARLDSLAAHPETQERRHKSEQKDVETSNHLLTLFPSAFLYHFEGMVPCPSGKCYHMSFTPNPHFTSPDLESNVLRGIAGDVWIDAAQERLTRIEGHFIAEVDFGFGVIGKLNRGGTVLLEESEVDAHDWEFTHLTLHVTGKAFLVKSLSFQVNEETSHFSPVPPGLKYRDAIQLLKSSTPDLINRSNTQ
jgi:hypothetical protein